MSMNLARDWTSFPMGPKIRSWLGISNAQYTGSKRDLIPAAERGEFIDFVADYAHSHQAQDEQCLVDMMDELLGMDFPLLVLKLADLNQDLWTDRDFRSLHIEALAAMYANELSRAELKFREAQEKVPSEPAPYVNLVQILTHDNRIEEASLWLDVGMKASPNHYALWDLFLDALKARVHVDPATKVYERAKTLHSWAGLSLFAEIDPEGQSLAKAFYLEPFYSAGERGLEFLLEYTGALGVAGEYEKIPAIVWEFEKSHSEKAPWQLELHSLQAQLASENFRAFEKQSHELLKRQDFPEQNAIELKKVMAEVAEEQANK